MKRSQGILIPPVLICSVLMSATATDCAQPAAVERPNFTGAWTLNRALSDAPAAAGFGSNPAGARGDQIGATGRAGRGGFRDGIGPEQRGGAPRSGVPQRGGVPGSDVPQ